VVNFIVPKQNVENVPMKVVLSLDKMVVNTVLSVVIITLIKNMKKVIDLTNSEKKVYVMDGQLTETENPLEPHFLNFDVGKVNNQKNIFKFDKNKTVSIGIKFDNKLGYWQYFPKECIKEIIKQLKNYEKKS
jgi:hypothetical protein